MSINYCTIGRDRIDGFCGSQRAKVLARLIHEAGHDVVVPPVVRPPSGGGGTSIRPGPSFRTDVRPGPFYRPPGQDLARAEPALELPFVTVTVEIMAMRGSETIEVTSRLDFVVVTGLEFNEAPEISVNISEMEV